MGRWDHGWPEPVKAWSRGLLAAYLVVLVWVVLFTLSFDPVGVVRDYRSRSLNLLPFAGFSWAHGGELVSHVVAFVPLGLLLGVVLPRAAMWRKVALACLLSLALETTQYVLATGTTDVTDVISNTLGAFLGVAVYDMAARHGPLRALDRVIVVAGTVLLVAVVLLPVLVLRVRY